MKNLYDALASAIYLSKLSLAGQAVETDDQRIRASGLYEDWTAGAFVAGDIRNVEGQTWECFQAHDNGVYPDIVPGNAAWFTFWRPLHGTSPETARTWVQPQHGTTDTYKAGECMIWTDGTVKRAKRETNFSPAEYADDWEDI